MRKQSILNFFANKKATGMTGPIALKVQLIFSLNPNSRSTFLNRPVVIENNLVLSNKGID
ncbi:hypothetical protein BBH88_15245 [Planococcus antarcticus DSM 14505]|uniref:Uncharacterized protein n=1 Tax=Planococcus antarcticus DSM 14505 TaxID=1185653 RepID=A0ABM6D7Q1_9BACL|nr:hypothetical protein BBH88_15245 [Planococcus antarcticus DSM 14505]